jgi:hypothetical protein
MTVSPPTHLGRHFDGTRSGCVVMSHCDIPHIVKAKFPGIFVLLGNVCAGTPARGP